MAAPRNRKAFPIAMVVTLSLALLPSPWTGLLDDVASVVRLPLLPLSHMCTAAADWFNPGAVNVSSISSEQAVRRLLEERDHAEQQLAALQLQLADLRRQLEEVMQVPVDLRVPTRPISARITSRDLARRDGPVEVNRGERDGIEPGTVAVHHGVHLVGRIIRVDGVKSVVLPLTNADTGYIRARVLPADRPDLPITQAHVIQLRGRGDGTFVADASRDLDIAEGDTVKLDDEAWPQTAQAMHIGTVTKVRRKDEEPLRDVVIIEPRFRVRQLSTVTLKVELDGLDVVIGQAGGGVEP